MQTDVTGLANNSQHCWMLHVASVCTPCCMLLDVVACCWVKFETGQTFQPTTPNISFVPWSPSRSTTMLDPLAQLFQHCWGHARSLRMVYNDLWVVSFPRCTAGPNIVVSCCIRLHTTADTHATMFARSLILRFVEFHVVYQSRKLMALFFLELARAPSRLWTKPLTEKVNLATFLSSGCYLKGERKQNKKQQQQQQQQQINILWK